MDVLIGVQGFRNLSFLSNVKESPPDRLCIFTKVGGGVSGVSCSE